MRIDILTITNMLAQHLNSATPLHVAAAHEVVKYLKGYKYLGITFTTQKSNDISAFFNFPLPPNKLSEIANANWGPQNASVTLIY